MIEKANQMLVGALGSGLNQSFIVSGLSPRQLTRDEALNLAAWLLVMADEPIAFEHVSIETQHGPVYVSIEFAELLARVMEGT